MILCRHCRKWKVNRPRGLCWRCYYTPGLREQYPSTSKYAVMAARRGGEMTEAQLDELIAHQRLALPAWWGREAAED